MVDAAAYAELTAIATKLRGPATATTLDDLAQTLRSARDLAGICRARLDAVRREIETEVAAIEAETQPGG